MALNASNTRIIKVKKAMLEMLRKEINSGATRIFRPMGKLLLCRKESMGKMGDVFADGQKAFSPTKYS
jgi:hypothetical protein